jgi:hypothetical protein
MSIWPGSDGWTPPGHRLVIELRARCGIAVGQIETSDYRVADRRFDVAGLCVALTMLCEGSQRTPRWRETDSNRRSLDAEGTVNYEDTNGATGLPAASAGPPALEPKHRTLATPPARSGRVQTPWTSSNTAAPAKTITDVAAAPVKKPTAQSSARSRN